MERRMPEGRLWSPGPPSSIPDAKAVFRRTETRGLPDAETPNDLEKLEETANMLRASIEALSPDVQEIQKTLSRPQEDAPDAPERQLGFRLIVTVVVLVVTILVLDLIFT